MMKKDPVRLYGYFILLLMIKKEYKVLGGWTVMQKSVLSEKYPWQDKTVLFSINSSKDLGQFPIQSAQILTACG